MAEERHQEALGGRVSRRAFLSTAALGGAAWLVGCQAPAPAAPAVSAPAAGGASTAGGAAAAPYRHEVGNTRLGNTPRCGAA